MPGRDSNPRLLDRESDTLPTAPRRHPDFGPESDLGDSTPGTYLDLILDCTLNIVLRGFYWCTVHASHATSSVSCHHATDIDSGLRLIEFKLLSYYYISAHRCYRFSDVHFSSDVADVWIGLTLKSIRSIKTHFWHHLHFIMFYLLTYLLI